MVMAGDKYGTEWQRIRWSVINAFVSPLKEEPPAQQQTPSPPESRLQPCWHFSWRSWSCKRQTHRIQKKKKNNPRTEPRSQSSWSTRKVNKQMTSQTKQMGVAPEPRWVEWKSRMVLYSCGYCISYLVVPFHFGFLLFGGLAPVH